MRTQTKAIFARIVLVAVIMTTGAFGVSVPTAQAVITDGENATDVLGQTDGIFDDLGPDFTKNVPQDDQNGDNGYGYNDVFDTAIDTVNHRLFVTDPQAPRVLVYELNVDNTLADAIPDNVLGQTDFLGSGGGTTASTFSSPHGLAYDSTGNRLFVADKFNHRVLVFDTTTIVDGEAAVNVLGQEDFTSNFNASAPSTQDGMNQPVDMALDGGSRLFVSDANNSRVLVFDITAIADGENAINVLGQPDFATNDNNTTATGFEYPQGLAYDPTGNRLFVSDTYNYRVMVFDVAAITNGESAANVIGQDDFVTTDYDVSSTRIGNPFSVAFDDPGDRLFVVDNDTSRVMVFNVASITDGEAAVNVLGVPDFVSFGGNDGAAALSTPNGVSYGDGRVYVADGDNGRVMIFDVTAITNGEDAVDLVGQTMYSYFSSDPSQPGLGFYKPVDGVLDSVNHRYFVVEENNHRVVVYNLNADDTFPDRYQDNVLGQPSLRHNAFATSQSGLRNPSGAAYDSGGNRLFVADRANNRVVVYDVAAITDGENATNVLGQATFTTSSATTTQSGLSGPMGVTYDDAADLLYVEDTGNNRVMVYDVASISNGENAVEVLGQSTFTRGDADGGTGLAGFSTPFDSVVDTVNHRLFISDNDNHRVLVYNLDSNDVLLDETPDFVLGEPNFTTNEGGFQTFASAYYLDDPGGLAYDPTGNRLFVADTGNNRILVFDVASITNGEPAVNVLAQANFTSVTFGNLTQNRQYNTGSLAYDGNHNYLYATDFGNSRVMVYDVASITNGENAVNVIGQPNFTTANWGTPSQSNLAFPDGVAFDAASNHLFVSDTGYHRVMVFDVATISNGEAAINILGQSGFTTQTSISPPTQASTQSPHGIVHDPNADRLFVSNAVGRVSVFDVASISNNENAVNVLGQTTFTTSGTGLSQSTFGAVGEMGYDPTNDLLYMADMSWHRVLVFDVGAITNGENAVEVMGQGDFTSGGANGSASASGLESPTDSAIDSVNHRLFIADSGNGRVVVYDLDVDNSPLDGTADAVLGKEGLDVGGFGETADDMYQPVGVEYDAANDRLFVADSGYHRVLVFSVAAITDGEDAVNVLGQADFTSISSASTQNGFDTPMDVTYDAGNDAVFVIDANNDRVMMFDAAVDDAGPPPTNDPTLSNNVRMSRLKIGTSSTVEISFELQNELTGTWTATFPVGFTVTGAMTSGTCSGGGTVDTFAFNGGSRTMTAEKHACSGTLTLSGGTVTTPGSPGLYFVTWTNDDPGEGGVAIVDDDQVTVTAQVDSSITFDLDTATTDTESSAPYAVSLGAVTTADTRVSGAADAVNYIWLDLSTNAGAGAVVTVRNANGASGLVSTSVPADSIASADGAVVDGTENYGLCSVTTSDAGGNLDALAPFDGTCSGNTEGNTVGGFTGSAQQIYDTDSAPIAGGRAQIAVQASVSATTPAHNDYTDTLTFIATGTF